MPLTSRRFPWLAWLAVASAAVARPAAATESDVDAVKVRCVKAYEQAQWLRKQSRLTAAKNELRTCMAEACPALVARDCVVWMREVEAQVATVIVSARTPEGRDRSDVRVAIDGREVQARLTGASIEVDPGEHVFRYAPAGAPPREERVIVNAGEKNRLLRVLVPSDAIPRDRPGARPPEARRYRAVPIVLGSAAVVLAGAGIFLDIQGSTDLHGLRTGCAPACSPSDVQAARTKIILGDSLIASSLIAGGAAVWLWLRAPRVVPTADGARLTWSGSW